jgi:exodeoxyribonuclease VII large subunit
MFGAEQTGSIQLALALGPERRVFRVSELSAELQELFERNFSNLWVAGEISGCRVSGNGHHYFVLRDQDAQVKCVLFKSTARYARVKPQDGLDVLVRGRLEVYAVRGEYQLIVDVLEPQGAGALQLAFEQLKKKLSAEGLFDSTRKRSLPKLPRRIGIVTSPSGAVLRDMIHIWARRFPGLHIRVFPAQVQGEGSVEQICAGLQYFSRPWAEVVIVARGGGSLEDLWSFNEERVARAVAASPIPVISAIGHETDFTICDFVADYRAPTPSAAAEVVVCTRQSLLEQIDGCRAKLTQLLRYRVLLIHRRLEASGTERRGRLLHRAVTRRMQVTDELDTRLQRSMAEKTGRARQRLAELTARLAQSDLRLRLTRSEHRRREMEERLRRWRPVEGRAQRVREAESRLLEIVRRKLTDSRVRIERAYAHMEQLSPLAVLARGYAIVENASGHVIRSASETAVGEALRVRLSEGGLRVTVDSYTEE